MLRQILITPSKREGGLSGCIGCQALLWHAVCMSSCFIDICISMGKACAWWAASGLWFSKVHIDRNFTNTGQDVSNQKQETYLYHFFLSYEQLNNADIKIQGMLIFVCFSYMGLVSLSNPIVPIPCLPCLQNSCMQLSLLKMKILTFGKECIRTDSFKHLNKLTAFPIQTLKFLQYFSLSSLFYSSCVRFCKEPLSLSHMFAPRVEIKVYLKVCQDLLLKWFLLNLFISVTYVAITYH